MLCNVLYFSFIIITAVISVAHAETTITATSDPSNVSNSSSRAPSTSMSAASTPVTSAATPVTSAATPVTAASTPVTATSTPVTAASTPVTAASTPVTAASTSVSFGTPAPKSNKTSESQPTAPPNQLHSWSSSGCSCDLSVDFCDVNCCCDDDCPESIKASFSTCLDAVLRKQRLPLPSCVSEAIVVGTNNLPFVTEVTDNGLFCVKDVNFQEQKLFPSRGPLTLTQIKSEVASAKALSPGSDFDDIIGRKELLVDISAGDQFELNLTEAKKASKYIAGQPFVRLLSDPNDSAASCATFNLPSASDFSTLCLDSSPSPFLERRRSVCDRKLDGNFGDVCNDADSPLHSAFYLGNLLPGKVIKRQSNGSDYEVLGCAVPDKTLDQPAAVEITIAGDGCDASFNVTTNSCDNAVKSVSYCIHINDNGWVEKAEATFECGSFEPLNMARIRHEVTFGIDGDCGPVERRSGNPGYLNGKPILAGKYNGSDDVPVSERNIIILKDPLSWLTNPGPSTAGQCSRQSTLFNHEIGNICQFDLSPFKQLSADQQCPSLRSNLSELFRGPSQPDRVAIFGNSDPQNVAEWVTIHDTGWPSSSSSSSSTSSSICNDVLTGIRLQILIAREGDVLNPQSKIVGVSRHFTTKRVKINVTKQLFLAASVSFIDVTRDAENVYKPAPVISAKVPQDFFYPLFQHGAASAFPPTSAMVVVATFVAILLVSVWRVKFD